MSADLIAKLIDRTVETVVRHAGELTELDQAIGDGDHGLNMKRGFEPRRKTSFRSSTSGRPCKRPA